MLGTSHKPLVAPEHAIVTMKKCSENPGNLQTKKKLIFLRALYNANGIEICIRVLPHDDIGSYQGAEFLE